MPGDRASSGERAGKRLRSARNFNNAQEAAQYYQQQQRLGSGIVTRPSPVPTDLIKVKNNTGATRIRGDVLEVGDIVTGGVIDREHLWFDGSTPADRYVNYCVLKHRIPSGEIAVAQVSGVCIARIDLAGDPLYNRATILSSVNYMSADKSGPIQILWQPNTTGIQECVVNLSGSRELTYKYTNVYFNGTYATNADVTFTSTGGILKGFSLGGSGSYITPTLETSLPGMYMASMSATMESDTAPDGARLTLTLLVNGSSPGVSTPCRAAREQLIRYDAYGAVEQYSAENVAFSRVIELALNDQAEYILVTN